MRTAVRILGATFVLAVVAFTVVWFFFPGALLRIAERVELSAAGLHRAETDVADHHIVYLEGGFGPNLVLIHGFGADKSNWVRMARSLTPRFHVIVPDLPGFGESSRKPNARYAVIDQAERVHAFLQKLGVTKACIAGNSMGGAIAGAYAAGHASEVECLWLIAPAFVRGAKKSELDELMAKGENPLLVQNSADVERLIGFVFVERPSIPRPILAYITEQAIAHRDFNEKVLHDLLATPFALDQAVKGLKIPTLVTWGDHDRLVDVSGAAILAAAIPGAKLDVVTNVGHAPMVERPDPTARAFLAFRGVG